VNLVVHQVRELEHVDRADRDRLIEALAAATIAQLRFAIDR